MCIRDSGCRCSPCTATTPDAGSPNACGCGSSPSQRRWLAPGGESCSTSPPERPGPTWCKEPSYGCAPWPSPADLTLPVPTTPARPPAQEPAPTRDDTRASCRTPAAQSHPNEPNTAVATQHRQPVKDRG